MARGIIGDSTEESIKILSRQKKQRGKYHKKPKKLLTSRDASMNSRFPQGTFRTDRGELVKSQGELTIANFLYHEGLQYTYERPIRLGKFTIRPDFYLNRYNVFVEYWGMLDDPMYFRSFKWKVGQYRKSKVRLIPLQQSDLADLHNRFHSKLEQILENG